MSRGELLVLGGVAILAAIEFAVVSRQSQRAAYATDPLAVHPAPAEWLASTTFAPSLWSTAPIGNGVAAIHP